jgi:LPS O-antigen subunit length determinant protein (WzzB/FepE family)
VREVDPPKKAEPSAQEAYKEFTELLAVSKDKTSGFVTLAIKHVSPVVARQWVTWFIEDVNNAMRDDDVREAERSIAYLKEQVAATLLADLQSMFFELIQKQTETIMLAKVRPEYLFKTIDPAIVPEQKAEPKRAIICILGTFFGSIIAVLWVLISHYMFKLKEPE